MAKAPQRANGTSHQQAEVGTGSELTAYDDLARSRNGKQLCRFVDCYVTDSASATAAVRAAGYKTQHPSQKAWELMRRPLVAAAVAQKMREGEDRTKITQDRVLHKLAIVAFASLDDYEIDPATRKGLISLRSGPRTPPPDPRLRKRNANPAREAPRGNPRRRGSPLPQMRSFFPPQCNAPWGRHLYPPEFIGFRQITSATVRRRTRI